MSHWVELTARDQHRFNAYVAEPESAPKGAVVVLQEIFGVNRHIRSVCDRFAGEGYMAAAPALFDRVERDYEAGYDAEDVKRGRELAQGLDLTASLDDIDTTVDHLEPHGKVSVVGFCLGGSLAYRFATRSKAIACAVCYYGGRIPDWADETPKCPTILHFGEEDAAIPMDKVDLVRRKQPDLPLYTYPAGHGFNCDRRDSYEPASARLAWERTMALIEERSRG